MYMMIFLSYKKCRLTLKFEGHQVDIKAQVFCKMLISLFHKRISP